MRRNHGAKTLKAAFHYFHLRDGKDTSRHEFKTTVHYHMVDEIAGPVHFHPLGRVKLAQGRPTATTSPTFKVKYLAGYRGQET